MKIFMYDIIIQHTLFLSKNEIKDKKIKIYPKIIRLLLWIKLKINKIM